MAECLRTTINVTMRVGRWLLLAGITCVALPGARAAEVAFEGPGGRHPIDLRDLAAPTSSARLDLRRAVAEAAGSGDGVPKAEIADTAGLPGWDVAEFPTTGLT